MTVTAIVEVEGPIGNGKAISQKIGLGFDEDKPGQHPVDERTRYLLIKDLGKSIAEMINKAVTDAQGSV